MAGGWSIFVAVALLVLPSYFKFVLDSNSLSGASIVVTLGYLSVKRRLGKSFPLSLKFSKSESPFELSVLSYNIFLRPPFIKNNGDDFKNERLQEFINQMDRFDIICLQEMFSLANSRKQLVMQAARERGFLYQSTSISPPWFTRKFIDAGLLILSKYPILQTDAMIYRSGNQIDSYAAKQVIYAKVQVSPVFFLHLFTTHLQASYFDNLESTNLVNDAARANQVYEMTEFVKSKTRDSPYPALITGDFNINARKLGDPFQETTEYVEMMKTLDPSGTGLCDLLKKFYRGEHPITYGDSEEIMHESKQAKKPREILLTHTADHCCELSIDYQLFQDTERNRQEKVLEVVNAEVEPFFVDPEKFKFAQLSDHYGTVSTLRVNNHTVGVEGPSNSCV